MSGVSVVHPLPDALLWCDPVPVNFIIHYFWSRDFQPIGCVEKCAINHVKHT